MSRRDFRRCLWVSLVAELWGPGAFAQGTTVGAPGTEPALIGSTTEPRAASGGTAPDGARGRGDDAFCGSNWFAMGPCRNRKWTGPEIMLGADLGGAVMTETGPFGFNKGVGSATEGGPSWGLRAGVEILPWLGVEGRYIGAYNSAQGSVSPTGSVGFFTTAGEAVVRLTAPLPFVRPYIFGGVGYYDLALVGSSTARAGSPFHSSAQPGVPVGFGFDVPLTWYLSADLEAGYHWQLNEDYSAVTTNGIDGGDLSTVSVVVRARL